MSYKRIAIRIMMAITAVICLLVIGFGLENDDSEEYRKNGTLVRCRVINVISRDNDQTVTVEYESAEGDTIEADCNISRRVSSGDEIEGYVLPDRPMYVSCPRSMVFKYVTYGAIGVLILAILVLGCMDTSTQLKEMEYLPLDK